MENGELVTDARPPASIVIPVYKESFLTRVCLASLALADLRGAEVVVMDNGSSDDTPALLAEWQDGERRRVVRSDENLGFGRGCNLGAAGSRGDVVVFLNNDTFVLRDWLTALLRAFDDPSVKVAGSRLLYPSGRVQHAGIAFNELGPHHIFVGLPGDSPLVLEPRDYQVVTGAALAIRREEFERLGGFDDAFLNSFEDVDLCLRVRRDSGRVVYVPDSVAYHWESMTEGRVGPDDMRNYNLFVERWKGRWDNDIPRLLAAAQAAGYDLSDRVPSRREVIDRQKRIEEFAGRIDELERREREAERLAGMRSVRAALRLRDAFRKVVPRSD
jgi:GT2 family glycosyltransferase